MCDADRFATLSLTRERKEKVEGIVRPFGRFIVSSRNEELAGRDAYWFLVRDFHPLFITTTDDFQIPFLQASDPKIPTTSAQHYLGLLDDKPCFVGELPLDAEPDEGTEFVNLRALHPHVEEEIWGLAARAVQIVDWSRTHQYCGRCGAGTVYSATDRALHCPECGLSHYPRLSPAVIVLVHRDNQVLLGRSSRFPNAFYSVLAGFVEPGESLEETVAREIYEETAILVKDIKYFGSQPWPFPNSLMIGFTATYAGGTIKLLDDEIQDAGWFTADDLPVVPGSISIARKLIDWWVDQQTAGRPVPSR